MKVYVVTSRTDKCEVPLAVFDTLRECADFIGVTLDHLKHCRYSCSLYATKKYIVEGVIIENL